MAGKDVITIKTARKALRAFKRLERYDGHGLGGHIPADVLQSGVFRKDPILALVYLALCAACNGATRVAGPICQSNARANVGLDLKTWKEKREKLREIGLVDGKVFSTNQLIERGWYECHPIR